MKKWISVCAVWLMLLSTVPWVSAASFVSVNVLEYSDIYNGTARTGTNDLYLYGDADMESFVTYTFHIPEDGVYRLDGTYAVQGATEVTELTFTVGEVKLPEIRQIPKTDIAWKKQTGLLHNKIPFRAGTQTLRIALKKQSVKSGLLLYNMTLIRMGAYEEPSIETPIPMPVVEITSPAAFYDGEVRSDAVYLYGKNNHLGWVEYPISVEQDGVYRLMSSLSVSGGDTAKVHIAIDGVKLEQTTSIPPYITDWVKRDAVLYEYIPLTSGEHTLRIYQAELEAQLLLYRLFFEPTGEKMELYHTANGLLKKVTSAEKAGDYIVSYSEKRTKGGTMVVSAYQKGRLIAVRFAPYSAGDRAVSVTLSNLPAGCELKTLFLQDTITLKPVEQMCMVKAPKTETPRDLYVSPAGSDLGDGTKDHPFRTIQKARETVRTFGTFTKNVNVYLAPGEYPITKPLRFTEEDGGRDGYSVIYRAQDTGHPPVISGGTKVENWQEWEKGIYKAKTNINDMRTLYVNQNPAVRAKSKYLYEPDGMTENGVKLSHVNFPILSRAEDMELVWLLNWTAQRTPVKQISYGETTVEIGLDQPAYSRALSASNNSYTTPDAEKPFYLENALELLDEPGEFYFDKSTKEIYYYPFPEEDLKTSEVYAGTTEFMVEISGKTVLEKAKNLVFDSLIFRYGAWNGASERDYGVLIGQADALKREENTTLFGSVHGGNHEMLPAQFRVQKAEHIAIRNCEFSCLGSSGISLTNAVRNCEITGNVIRDISGSGIVAGHFNHVNPEKMDAGEARCENIEIANNVIRRVANEYLNCCGISLYYTKQISVHHNDIRELPYTGITLGWGWNMEEIGEFGNHVISENYIEDVMSVLDDGAHIYTLGASHDNVIAKNHLVTSGDHRGGVYLDQGTTGVTVSENLVENCMSWLNARQNIGLDNTVIENNFFAGNAKYTWVTGTYGAESELSDTVNGETTYEDKICYNTYRNNTRFTTRPQRAQEIADGAGLTEEYSYLAKLAEAPAWRKCARSYIPDGMYRGTNGWIEAEDFRPVEGVGYSRQGTTIPAAHLPIRPDAPDVAIASVNFWGVKNFVITNTQNGDWFSYDYKVQRDGNYDVKVRLANGGNTAYMNVYADGVKVIDKAAIGNTGDYHTYETVSLGTVPFTSGDHILTFEIVQTGLHLDRWSVCIDDFSGNDPDYDEGK